MTWKLWPTDVSTGKVRVSPKTLECFLYGPWTSAQNFINPSNSWWDIHSETETSNSWAKMVKWQIDRHRLFNGNNTENILEYGWSCEIRFPISPEEEENDFFFMSQWKWYLKMAFNPSGGAVGWSSAAYLGTKSRRQSVPRSRAVTGESTECMCLCIGVCKYSCMHGCHHVCGVMRG